MSEGRAFTRSKRLSGRGVGAPARGTYGVRVRSPFDAALPEVR